MTGRILTADSQKILFHSFDKWMGKTSSKQKLFVAGNHDHALSRHFATKHERRSMFSNVEYLENDLVRMEGGLTVFGTPVSMGASRNRAFQSTEFLDESVQAAASISDQIGGVDILLTHGFGSGIGNLLNHNIHLCGHFHEMYGVTVQSVVEQYDDNTWRERRIIRGHKDSSSASRTGKMYAKQVRICASICDGRYNLTNPPIVVDYPRSSIIHS
jgi:hypothetical protein